jgi:hypothetical protein
MIIARRPLLQMLAAMPLAGCTAAQAAVYHDPECGCCKKWISILAMDGKFSVKLIETTDRAQLHRQIGLPSELASCHTAIIEGYAFEGHVPHSDIARLLSQRPKDIAGLAVPGMPKGSPGMESDDPPDHFVVISFGQSGQREYARY